jgi:hypothetical protein
MNTTDKIFIVEFLEWKTNSNKTVYTYPFDDDSEFGSYLVANLKFDTSWDWLMLVVEKIEDFFTFKDSYVEFQVISYEDEVKVIAKHSNKPWEIIVEVSADGTGKFGNTYKAVLEFIKWHNEQKELGISI